MTYPKLRAAANAEILAVIENLPVSANGFFLTPEQMASVEAVLNTGEKAAADLIAANTSVETQTAEVTRLTGELTTTKGSLTTAEAEVTRLKALGGKPAVTAKEEDEFEANAAVDPMAFDFQKDILKRFD